MIITKDTMARYLSEKTGYYLKDVRCLLAAMDDFVKDSFANVTEDEEVSIQIVEGCKLTVKVMPERQRKHPQTQEDIVCKAQTKPQARFSKVFREYIQKQYEENIN